MPRVGGRNFKLLRGSCGLLIKLRGHTFRYSRKKEQKVTLAATRSAIHVKSGFFGGFLYQ
ncbi:hypothetical protein EBB07_24110 [Paenibacillaceae bacterium]|nr:hypothetical protein EBB07_24110 [Paenibacillaceae bacterium]